MNRLLLAFLLSISAILPVLPAQTNFFEKAGIDQIMVGYGQSIPGFGETTETVRTADLILRWKLLTKQYDPKDGPFRSSGHQRWMEIGAFGILSDSDHQDSKDYGIASVSFLAAWTFDFWDTPLEPYLFCGGGPVYVFADINGVGSDICGNYQAGVGLKGFSLFNQPTEVQLKYHHISNLEMADPNIALNSVRLLISLPF